MLSLDVIGGLFGGAGVLGIRDLRAVSGLHVGGIQLRLERGTHLGQVFLAQGIALGGFALIQANGLGLFASALMRAIFGFIHGGLLFYIDAVFTVGADSLSARGKTSLTRFAGPLTRPDPSVASRHLPTLWGVTL